ncbi:tRNA1(Val) (adenine(37)-N6)-methyltransferase [Garciella nitratireducens]|uniref:Methyltransferase small domain-containing protein n=1 Tax=Garciella nitratireducens DSM 15102 TaxID=1121911 RepID=A0A1T4P7V0_9FIRM|nr:tRNA1(Val) (adenine(37)-N6)-methyltransferase [Garciella nitratireducens]SJZ87407.1 Methyltransferase small domain-containing protein [Garciella nitratireducens DSM 15102]
MKNYPQKQFERIDDLQRKGLKIIQNTQKFCFGIDAVLLAHFAAKDLNCQDKVVDLGTGTGIIPLLLWGMVGCQKILALEIQKDMVEMAKRSVALNGLQEKIEIIEGDIKNPPPELIPNTYDAIVTNPPYMESNKGIVNPTEGKAIARHEILCNLEDILYTAKRLLKPKGKFSMIHRSQRLVDILSIMRKVGIEPKKLRLVYPSPRKTSNLVLVQGNKGGKPHLVVEKPLYIYQQNGEYTQEIYEIYGDGKQKQKGAVNRD